MEESLVPATGRVIGRVSIWLMAAVSLRIWVAARCHPGLNQYQIAAIAIDRGDYLWRCDDYLLHRLRAAAARLSKGQPILLPHLARNPYPTIGDLKAAKDA